MRRRSFLKSSGLLAAGAVAAPHFWVKNEAVAQTSAHGALKHLLYIRLSGGFRFTAAFNGDVADEYNPFGLASDVPSGVEWGPTALLGRTNGIPDLAGLMGANATPVAEPVTGRDRLLPLAQLANEIAVMPCVDHEPLSGSADGNHNTGLERYLTGYVGGTTSIFTMLNYGLRNRPVIDADGNPQLPAFVLGSSGMARGTGPYAGHRPPVLSDGGFDQFGFSGAGQLPFIQKVDATTGDTLYDWTKVLDARAMRQRGTLLQPTVDAYLQAREATDRFAAVFRSETLKIANRSTEAIDGISNAELAAIFGDNGAARSIRLALRLFHFGSPAVYLDQGGYDLHSGEENGLPGRIDELNRLISALNYVLKRMSHPSGGTYWDHTLVVLGSEFGRTARGGKFNSARGSDHGGDYATRWMSMPFMGGLVSANGGRIIGAHARRDDLAPQGTVYSYRSVCKTLMDALGCDHREFFPADEPINELFG